MATGHIWIWLVNVHARPATKNIIRISVPYPSLIGSGCMDKRDRIGSVNNLSYKNYKIIITLKYEFGLSLF